MPASSKQQQKFMGIVHTIQKGDIPASDASPEAQKVAQDMKPSDVKDFASTSHKGLPRKVKQEILKKLKEYAMTLPGHHVQPPSPMDSLRSDDEMGVNEGRVPQNFSMGTTVRDYHTKLGTTPREDYDDTNFRKDISGQPDLKEGDDKLEMLKLFNKALRVMPGSQKQKEIIKQLNVLRIKNNLKPLDEKKLVNKIAEYASKLDLSYLPNKAAKLDGTPEDKDAIDREEKSVNEAGLKGYLVADVVDDIIKSIGTRFVSGEIKNHGNRNKIYLKLKDVKFGSGVVKILKSRFGIEAKEEIFGGKGKFGSMPSVSFWADEVISESVNEELSFDEKQMVIGIIEILKQVDDRKNRMRIALNMLKKFKEEGIEFEYQKFVDALKEYSMGSYEYDNGNRELGEAMIWQAKDMIHKIVPKSTFGRYANVPSKNREFVDSIIRDLTGVLNRFYKQNDINLTLR